MAELKLNTTTSIVDFLKSQGKAADFNSRKSLYESSGLSQRLGAYVSSGAQNVAFLKTLSTKKEEPVPIAPTAAPTQDAYDTQSGLLTDFGRSQGLPEVNAPKTKVEKTDPADEPIGMSGLSARDAASSIPGIPSADEVLKQVLGSAGFQNFQQKQQLDKTLATGEAEAQKQKLEAQTAADTKKFTDSMGRRGLFFSSDTQQGLQALAESLASSKLGVDRKLAGDLLKADFETKGEIIEQVADIVKEAQQGRKEAISALEKVGLTVVGDRVVPTLAAASAERAERNAALAVEREERLAQTAEFNQQATLARLELSEQAALRAERALQLSEERAAGGGTVTSGGLTLAKGSIGTAAVALNSTRGEDKWVDPNSYEALYNDWVTKKGLPQDFVKAFPPSLYVNPQNTSLPPFLQNKGGSTLIINPQAIADALSSVSATE